jgi:hypothetical protein
MAMISPICLENLIDMGKWMGLAHHNMEQHMVVPDRQFNIIAGYNLGEMEGTRRLMMQYCPQREEVAEDDPRYRFEVGLTSVQENWARNNQVVALMQMRLLEEALMEWVNDIAFAGPSRVAVRT